MLDVQNRRMLASSMCMEFSKSRSRHMEYYGNQIYVKEKNHEVVKLQNKTYFTDPAGRRRFNRSPKAYLKQLEDQWEQNVAC